MRTTTGLRLAVLTALTVAGLAAAGRFDVPVRAAQHPPSSLFTSISLDTCKPIRKQVEGKAWQCSALMPVYAAEREAHFYLAIGPNAATHKAAKQTLPAANTPVEHKSGRITIEWRIKKRAAGPAPYASIIHYVTQQGGQSGEVLVVTKIADGQSCHIAYVDALANADAIVLARAFADEKAAGLDCASTEPVWIGAAGPK